MRERPIRVLWLLNHTTLRTFEIEQFRLAGMDEVFTPKVFPYDEANLSANVDWSLDRSLTISSGELEVLNAQDWYGSPSEQAWEIVNASFDLAIIGFFPEQIRQVVRHFEGAIVLRIFGLARGYSYSQILYDEIGEHYVEKIKALGSRFWFGAGYEHLFEVEQRFLRKRNCFLPVGLGSSITKGKWEGNRKSILFVCPRIATSPYFEGIYKEFIANFTGFEYTISGAQPIVPDGARNIIGFVSRTEHDKNMREHRLMYYHSTEPNHVHYHPFEAIRLGMPLVFMAGGLLDRLGGATLPGRCKNIIEARKTIDRILSDDWDLIDQIRASQVALLAPMLSENCSAAWQRGIKRILEESNKWRSAVAQRELCAKPPRIGILLPVPYRGGSLRGAIALANAVLEGSLRAKEPAEVVFCYLEGSVDQPKEAFNGLASGVKMRAFRWMSLGKDQARRAMRYAGHENWFATEASYSVPDDYIGQLKDCDLWVVISDRVPGPLLPIRPIVHMVYDYLQRYVDFSFDDRHALNAVRSAERVLVTTRFTREDALQYAGVHPDKVIKVPMLAIPSVIPRVGTRTSIAGESYFLWTTNASPHKNHSNAVKALQIYYEELNGLLECRITGVNSQSFGAFSDPHLKSIQDLVAGRYVFSRRIKTLGELGEAGYWDTLASAEFLWHPASIDNGTFSVIEAAKVGVPSLSSNYPAMREIDAEFSLNLCWMDPNDPREMAIKLKYMELHRSERCSLLPSHEDVQSEDVYHSSDAYWRILRECL